MEERGYLGLGLKLLGIKNIPESYSNKNSVFLIQEYTVNLKKENTKSRNRCVGVCVFYDQ